MIVMCVIVVLVMVARRKKQFQKLVTGIYRYMVSLPLQYTPLYEKCFTILSCMPIRKSAA